MVRKFTIVGAGFVGLNTAYDIWKKAQELNEKIKFNIYDKNNFKIKNLKEKNLKNIKMIFEKNIDDNELNQFLNSCNFETRDVIKKEDEKIFICINTQGNIVIDSNNIFSIFKNVYSKNGNFSADIVIRSTVSLGLTNSLAKYLPNCQFGFFPERYSPADEINFKNIFGGSWQIYTWLKNYFNPLIYFTKASTVEAAKIYENAQRYVLISFANIMRNILKDYNLDYEKVKIAASTKSNFISVDPGLIGGECIGIDHKLINHCLTTSYDKFFETWNELLYEEILNELIRLIYKYENEIIFLGYEYKPNVYSSKNSKTLRLYKDLKKIFKKTFNIFDLKLIEDIIEEKSIRYKLDYFKNKKLIILVNHAATKKLIDKLNKKEINYEIIFDLDKYLKNFNDQK